MAYTNAEKAAIYRTLAENLSETIVQIEDIIASESEEHPELSALRQARDRLVGMVGRFSVNAKRFTESE